MHKVDIFPSNWKFYTHLDNNQLQTLEKHSWVLWLVHRINGHIHIILDDGRRRNKEKKILEPNRQWSWKKYWS